MKLLRRSSLRYLTRHGWQTGLAILGVGLGVAVVLAVDLAVSSARRGFTLSAEAVAGRATHQIIAGPRGLPDRAYVTLREQAGVVAAAPVVDGDVVAMPAGAVVRVLGIDPFADAPFRRYSGAGERAGPGPGSGTPGSATPGPGSPRLGRPGLLIGARAGLMSAATASGLEVEEGEWLGLEVGGRADSVRVVGLLEPANEATRLGLENLVVVDVGTAQALLGRSGLDRIDLILAAESAVEQLRQVLPADATVRAAGTETAVFRDMTRAFDLNLRALSLLALIFGIFLIYNSVTFSVVRRRRLLGTLRALGATRRQVFGIVQGEALLLGLAGAALGVVLGVALGQGLVRLVTRTIQDLYFVVTVRELIIQPGTLVRAVALGVLATLAAATPAALEAATTHPRAALLRSELESGLRRRLPGVSLLGAGLGLLGAAVLWISSTVDGSFVGLFGVILGMALLTPITTVALIRLLRPVAGRLFGVLGRMAARGVTAGLSRTAPAIAALTIAVATTIGVAVMVGSFRGSLARWLDHTLSADLYIAPGRPAGAGGARDAPAIDPAVVEILAGDRAVAEARRYRRGTVPSSEGPVDLMAIAMDSRLRGHFDFIAGDPARSWDDFAAGRALLASEPFAHHHDLGVGDPITLRTARGPLELPLAAVFRDYGSDRGMVMISYPAYVRLWGDSTVTTLALILEPESDRAAVVERLREATAPLQALSIRSDRAVGEASLTVFDRTFAITQVLRLLALIVAFVGVLSALMALQLERARELGVLRANGVTPGQVWTLVASQTGLMGLAAGLMALPVGLILAVLMIEFVNRRSFGWTIDLSLPPGVLIQAVGLAVMASLLAGVYPSWRMARASPAEALRGE